MNFAAVAVVFMIFAMLDVEMSEITCNRPKSKETRCADIPTVKFDYKLMQQLNPFFIYQTNVGYFNCSQLSFIGYAGTKCNYAGSVIVINKKETSIYDFKQVNGSIFQTTKCNDGMKIDYRMIYNNIKCRSRASYCAVVCDENGDKIKILACGGRTPQDAMDTECFLQSLNTKMDNPAYESYGSTNCLAPKYCTTFN